MPIKLDQAEELMKMISIAQPFDDKYTSIPRWTGWIESWTVSAVLLSFEGDRRPSRLNWFPISQLRRSEDGSTLYASYWILNKKGI